MNAYMSNVTLACLRQSYIVTLEKGWANSYPISIHEV